MKVALLIDGSTVARWQAECVRQIASGAKFIVYSCTNSRAGRRRLRHWPYYLLNLLSLRSRWTNRVAIPDDIEVEGRVEFVSEWDGAWQKLPGALLEQMRAAQPDVVIKFGVGLLRAPDASQLPIPILSYHHGDPRRFRGRPAGFHEMLQGDPVVGQIVQILSNRLDAGAVVAFAETKVHSQSYRATMREAYGVSPLLLPQAVRAIAEGRRLDITATGKAYRLPDPLTVVRFVSQRVWAKARRFLYGAWAEKAWQIAEAPWPATATFPPDPFPPRNSWRPLEPPPGYRFLADPFYHLEGDGILAEAISSSTGLGEILHLQGGAARRLLGGPGHFSYPATLRGPRGHFLVPEMCEWSPPKIFALDDQDVREVGELQLPLPCRLVDPTLFERDGTTFLFANITSEPGAVLRLWSAPSLFEPFKEHPASPILISPAGARMGGAIAEQDGALYRIGQDGRGAYGDGVLLFQIDVIGPTTYRERAIGSLRFDECRGPHTLNLGPDQLLFDYYRDRFDLLAGARRLRSRLAGRK